jgi:hypothetical protein
MMEPLSVPEITAIPDESTVPLVRVPPACTVRVLPLVTVAVWLVPLVIADVVGVTVVAVGAKATPRMMVSGAAAINWVKLSVVGSVVALSESVML